jgi:hypothetical protein
VTRPKKACKQGETLLLCGWTDSKIEGVRKGKKLCGSPGAKRWKLAFVRNLNEPAPEIDQSARMKVHANPDA